jgi:hypothetical protein
VAGDLHGAVSALPLSVQPRIQALATQAFVNGFSVVLWVAGWLGLLGALVVGTLMRQPIPPLALVTRPL